MGVADFAGVAGFCDGFSYACFFAKWVANGGGHKIKPHGGCSVFIYDGFCRGITVLGEPGTEQHGIVWAVAPSTR